MGRTYHRFKPVILFEKELRTSEFYDCKKKRWAAVIPEMEYRFFITLESDYPREIFGAPKYYVMKAIWKIGIKEKEQVFGSGTRKSLGDAILRFKANECFWNNLGRHAYRVYLDWINKKGKVVRIGDEDE
ncbi:MAG: hypothetical protein N2V75_03865 [Methanophagales archaeon]|nr:hypothetical protein [Methanophagales archaeon]